MIRFPDVVVAQRQGVTSVKPNDTKSLSQQQLQPQLASLQQHTSTKLQPPSVQQAPKLNINFSSKNKKKNNHTYQVSGKKRNANSISNAANNNSSSSSISGDSTGQVNNKNNNNVSYATNVSSSLASYSNSAKKTQSGASCSKSVSLDSISSAGADELCANSTSPAMNLHLVKCLTNQHPSPSNSVPTPSPSPSPSSTTATATASATQTTKKSVYSLHDLHHLGAQMSIFGYPNAAQKHDYANRMRSQRIEYSTYNGAGKSHAQYTNGNNDYGRYNSSNINKFNSPHNKSHMSNASISPPLSVISSGSSNHSGRGSNHSNHSNNMNYRNSQSFGMQSSHASNHYQGNYYYQGSPFCGGNNGSNSMHQQQQQQQQTTYSNSHHHPPNQSNQKNLHQMPSPPIYHTNNNYHAHNRNYQNGKKSWTSNYGRNKKYVNGNQYNSSNNNNSSSNSSNASNGSNATSKCTSAPNSAADRSRIDASTNQYSSNASKLSSAGSKSPSVSPITTTPPIVTSGNYVTGGDTEKQNHRHSLPVYPFASSDSITSLSTLSESTSDRSKHLTLPLSKIPTTRIVDASISPPLCISPSSLINSSLLQLDSKGAALKKSTIPDRNMCGTVSTSSMDRKDATPLSSCDTKNMQPPFHMNYSTSPTPGLTEELFVRLSSGLSSIPTSSATTNNTSNVPSGSASVDSSGSASMPMYNRNLILFDPLYFANNMPLPDFYNMPNAAFKSNQTHDGPHQKRR